MSLSELNCFFNANYPNDTFICLVSFGGVSAWNVIFIALLLLFVVGASIPTRKIGHGLMVGGFFMSLAGLALLALSLISVKLWFLAVLVCLAGLVITVIDNSSAD